MNNLEVNKYLDKSFDNELELINSLKWRPWIGNNYINKKILIVGDSHFEDGGYWQKGNKDATRQIIDVCVMDEKSEKRGKSKIHSSIEKVFYNKKNITIEESKRLWQASAYFNLVQELMTSSSAPPTTSQLDLGWESFLDVAKILKPTVCIKCGLRGFGRLGYVLNNKKKEWNFEHKEFLQNPRVLNLSYDEHKKTIVFIKHPSGRGGFSFKQWGDILQYQFPDLQTKL